MAWLVMSIAVIGCAGQCDSDRKQEPKNNETANSLQAGPTPNFVIAASVDRERKQVKWTVENHHTTSVAFETAVTLEEKRGQSFFKVDQDYQVSVRLDCSDKPPKCMTLTPGAALHPPALSSGNGGQCGCRNCVVPAPGTYRLSTRTCDGTHVMTSNAFSLGR